MGWVSLMKDGIFHIFPVNMGFKIHQEKVDKMAFRVSASRVSSGDFCFVAIGCLLKLKTPSRCAPDVPDL